MRKLAAVLIMAIWMVTILYLLFVHLSDIEAKMEHLRQMRSQWPTVQGKVIDVQFHEADILDDNDQSYVRVKFQYRVADELHKTYQTWDYYTSAQRNAISYSDGQPVTVYYDSAEVGHAVIEWRKVGISDVSAAWETILRILAFPSIVIGCIIIWNLITQPGSASGLVQLEPRGLPD